jgi:hypothetical protein
VDPHGAEVVAEALREVGPHGRRERLALARRTPRGGGGWLYRWAESSAHRISPG